MLKQIASNTIAQILSKIITAIIAIFLLSILTKFLSVELFGLYSKIFNYLGIFAFLADMGLYTIMIREISKGEEKSEKIVGNVLTLRILLGVIIIFLALLIALFIPGYNSNIELLSIFIIGFFTLISLMNSTFLAYMQSQLKMEFSLISVVTGKILNLSLVLLVVYLLIPIYSVGNECIHSILNKENSIIFVFISALFGLSLNTYLNYWYAKKSCKIKMKFDIDYIKHIFKISLPYGIALFLSVIYFKIDIILLSILEGDKADISIALYSLPMKIIEVLMVISGFYLNSILPKLSSYFDESHPQPLPSKEGSSNLELQKLLVISFKILFSFGLIVLTLGTLLRENVIKIIGNDSYINPINSDYSSSDAFLIVLAVLLFNAISLLFIYIFIASKKQAILLKINIFITLFNIAGNLILIPKYSFIGAGIVTLFSQILLFLITFYYSRRIIKFSFPKLFIFKIILLSILLFFTIDYLMQTYKFNKYLEVLIYGIIGTGIYGGFLVKKLKKS